MKVVAIVPAYNEINTIGEVIDKTARSVDEVVVVDDSSTDHTPSTAHEHGATVIEHTINTGVGGAVRTGYRYAISQNFDFAVQIDADGQHDPTKIPTLLKAAENGDMVIGSRYLNESFQNYSRIRKLGIRFFTNMVNSLGDLSITDVTSGFRVYRVSTLESIIHHSDRHWAIEQTLKAARAGLRIEEVSVEMPTRDQGQSQFDLKTFLLYPARMADVLIRVVIFR